MHSKDLFIRGQYKIGLYLHTFVHYVNYFLKMAA